MVFPVRFLVSGFCSLVHLLCMVAFKSIAVVIVLVIRVPGKVVDAILKQVAEALVSTGGFIAESTTDLVKSATSSLGQILLDSVTDSAVVVNSGVGRLVELTKNATESAPAKAAELVQDLSQMVCSINSLWNNLREAIAFVQEWA